MMARRESVIAETDVADMELMAEVNHGRWVVHCPFCAGAEFAWEGGPFMCCSCWNEEAGGKFLKMRFPQERKEIEALLLKRPKAENRNWHRDEPIEELKAENEKHEVK